MICKKCGKENTENAKFCAFCGAALTEGTYSDVGKSRKKKIFKAVSAVILVSVTVAAGIFIYMQVKEKQLFEDSFTSGDKYLEEMDYEKAEDSFLAAISIDPKQKEPYLKLIDTYIALGKFDDVVKTAENAVKEVVEEEKTEFEDILQNREDIAEYTWVSEPEIEADNIYYLMSADNKRKSYNELKKQKYSDYAVIKKDGQYGLIDWNGTFPAEPVYSAVINDDEKYRLQRSGIEDSAFWAEWRTFDEDSGKIENEEWFGSEESGINEGGFYYYDGLHNTNERYGYLAYQTLEPAGVIPVQKSEKLYEASDGSDRNWLTGPYALYGNGNLVTDFIYEECGSEESGIIAAKKDGKWGYIDTAGNEVIPFEYDASWTDYEPDISEPYCYAASEGYVPLVKNEVWEMRDFTGKVVFPPGMFDEIRPVYNGKCWVKKFGKWGVISLESKEEISPGGAASSEETAPAVYTDGPVELSGVLEEVEWKHPNGSQLISYVIRPDVPVDLQITVEKETMEFENCGRIQVINLEQGIDTALVGKRVTVQGELAQSPLTAYYLDTFVIWDAVIMEDFDGGGEN